MAVAGAVVGWVDVGTVGAALEQALNPMARARLKVVIVVGFTAIGLLVESMRYVVMLTVS